MFTIEYNNDTEDDDGSFYEWFTITDGIKVFKCDFEEDADWLCDKLNKITQIEKSLVKNL